ncbi:MAG: HAMP domain-containing histidine kinase [Deltaproteobacteria bacterium]|nr:MAG: HAMP domain-containing histidine kinase [Deltaproteobacteria bacterium]
MNLKKIGINLGIYGLVTFAVFAFIYLFYLDSKVLFFNNILTSLTFGLILFLLKKNIMPVKVYSHVVLIVTYIGLIVINLVLGGIHSPMNYWFIACILGAAFLLGSKGLLLWSSIILSTYTVLYLVDGHLGFLSDYQIILDASRIYYLGLSTLFGVITLIFVFAWFYLKINGEYHDYEKKQNDRLNFLLKILNHDLASPLMVTSILVGKEKNNITPKNLEKINKAHASMFELINSVRKVDKFFSKEPRLSQVDIKEAIEDVVEDINILFQEKEIKVEMNLNDQRRISCDEFILKNSILKNLITNAFKFSEPGSTIQIFYNENTLVIKDSGSGISKEDLKDIFNFEASISRTGTKGELGTGFGLPIVNECCERLGIKISVDSSTEGQTGTTFTLKF